MLKPTIINQTKDQIERLIRQHRHDEARDLLKFLQENNVTVDSDLRQFQNIVGMPVNEPSLAEVHQQERLHARRQFVQDRLTGIAIAAFFLITTGNIILPISYLLIDWTLNLGQSLTITRIILSGIGALLFFIIAAFILAVIG